MAGRMKHRFIVVSLFILLAICTTAVFAAKVEQSRISPQTGYGEPVDFCLDVSAKDVPKVYAVITYPDGGENKYILEYVDFSSKSGVVTAEGYCFKELRGYEFRYQGFTPKGTGTYLVTFVINDGIEESKFDSSFEVKERKVDVGTVDVCKTVEKVTSVDIVKALPPSMQIHGTEYYPGDNGTIFLQLVDSNEEPINTAQCWLQIFSPSKVKVIDNQPILYLPSSDGGYYFDYFIPNETGVYMPFVTCSYYYNVTYSPSIKDILVVQGSGTNYSNETYISVGSFGSAKIYSYIEFNLLNYSLEDSQEAYLLLYRISNFGNSLNVSINRITANWSESNTTGLTMPPADTTVWAMTTVTPTSTWVMWNVTTLVNSWINGTYVNYGMVLNYTSIPNNFKSFNSREASSIFKPMLIIYGHSSNKSINSLRGSGEVHVNRPIGEVVWQYENRSLTQTITATVDTDAIASAIWNYTIRNLTWWPSFTTPSDVWSYSIRNLTYYPAVSNLTADDVWMFADRNLTYYQMPAFPIYANLTAQQVWGYFDRNLTYYQYVDPSGDIWSYAVRNLTYYQIPYIPEYVNFSSQEVWEYAERNLTYYVVAGTSNLTVDQVWGYSERNLTYTPDMTDYQSIYVGVWNNTDRNLTWFPAYVNPAGDVWSYLDRNLTYYPAVSNLTAGDVWIYADRNLTYYPATTDAQGMWNYTARYIHGEII